MKIQRIETAIDSDLIADYITESEKYSTLLLDTDVYSHMKYLLWDIHPWKKGQLTKFVNRYRHGVA